MLLQTMAAKEDASAMSTDKPAVRKCRQCRKEFKLTRFWKRYCTAKCKKQWDLECRQLGESIRLGEIEE